MSLHIYLPHALPIPTDYTQRLKRDTLISHFKGKVAFCSYVSAGKASLHIQTCQKNGTQTATGPVFSCTQVHISFSEVHIGTKSIL